MRLSRRRTELALKVPTCMMQWMLPRIMRFQAEHPELQVQITTTWDHQVDFRMEPFDAAVIYAAGAGPDMHAIPLFDERLTPVCAPACRRDARESRRPGRSHVAASDPRSSGLEAVARPCGRAARRLDARRASKRWISRRTRRSTATASRSATGRSRTKAWRRTGW